MSISDKATDAIAKKLTGRDLKTTIISKIGRAHV